MLDKILLALRIPSGELDEEVSDLIAACKIDLSISGVDTSKLTDLDPIFIQVTKYYCRAYFCTDQNEKEGFRKAYNLLKEHMAVCGDYKL